MTETLIRHVSDTAFLVAHHRAVESARPDHLFVDPLAARLAGERGRAIAESLPTKHMTGWTVAVRTRIIDDYINQAIGRGVDTIINLGAGLDARPYRMELPTGLTWIEVDYPAVIAFKDERLRDEHPRCRLERIGVDLSDPTARRALLDQLDARARRALFITEGLLPYLDVGEAGALADDIRALVHVDGWVVDYLSPASVASRRRRRAARLMTEAPFKFEPPDWFAFFAGHGWTCREMRYLGVEGNRLGRRAPLSWAFRMMIKILRGITPRKKRGGFENFAGYALLAPSPPAGST